MSTNLGNAYVQIMPSAKGITGKIQKVMDPEATSAGKSAGSKMGSMIKKTVLAAGIGVAIKNIVNEGAMLEQSIGGVETLFKDSAGIVKKYANDAYKSAGLSANAYMENVTGFSASLLQSTGGDTEKAAHIANRAMVDMSDNANKMGTDIGSIQNAYQGFAKQNYTMLDNLKLGYGGTKKEMERLLQDATKLTGIKYNIENLDDVYNAIGVVQDQLGITGTTALEAEQTISGSLSSLGAAFKNTLGSLALGEDIKPSLEALATTLSTFLFDNFLPMVGNILIALPEAVIAFLGSAIPKFIDYGGKMLNSVASGISANTPAMLNSIMDILDKAGNWIKDSFPQFLNTGVEMISKFTTGIFNSTPTVLLNVGEILNKILVMIFDALPSIMESGAKLIEEMAVGLKQNMPEIINALMTVLSNLLGTIVEKYPEYFKKGWDIIGRLAKGLWDNLPFIIRTLGDLLIKLVKTIGSYLPKFLSKGLELIVELGFGFIKAIPKLVAKVPEITGAILGALGGLAGAFFDVGVDVIKGLWNGIKSVKDWIMGKISGFVDGIMGGIKKFFGIKSPSRRMADEIGEFLPSGIALGIEANTKPLLSTMEDLSDLTVSSFDKELSFGGTNYIKTFESGNEGTLESVMMLLEDLISKTDRNNDSNKFIESIVTAFSIVVSDMGIYINERQFGKVVTDLVKEKGLV